MHIEYEEFDSIEDMFLYMATASQPLKNILPVNSYKGYMMSFIPLNTNTGDTYLMMYVQNGLEPGIYEFDVTAKSYKKVKRIERADKNYFIVITPKRNTIADSAIKKL